MTKVELLEAIRRDYTISGLTIRQTTKRHGMHRRLVRQALRDTVLPPRKAADCSSPVLSPVMQ
jgi:ActR/RegA family two-component response regulator